MGDFNGLAQMALYMTKIFFAIWFFNEIFDKLLSNGFPMGDSTGCHRWICTGQKYFLQFGFSMCRLLSVSSNIFQFKITDK